MENNKQQTAVDWLVEQLKSQHNIDIERLAVTDKANGMHKEQIMEAWQNGSEVACLSDISVFWRKTSYDYYNETYETE